MQSRTGPVPPLAPGARPYPARQPQRKLLKCLWAGHRSIRSVLELQQKDTAWTTLPEVEEVVGRQTPVSTRLTHCPPIALEERLRTDLLQRLVCVSVGLRAFGYLSQNSAGLWVLLPHTADKYSMLPVYFMWWVRTVATTSSHPRSSRVQLAIYFRIGKDATIALDGMCTARLWYSRDRTARRQLRMRGFGKRKDDARKGK